MPIPYKELTPLVKEPPKKRRASNKRRHQRTPQVVSDRPCWVEVLDSFVFQPNDLVKAVITEAAGEWHMEAEAYGERLVAAGAELEGVFRAANDFLFKHAKAIWVKMDSRAVTDKYSHELSDCRLRGELFPTLERCKRSVEGLDEEDVCAFI